MSKIANKEIVVAAAYFGLEFDNIFLENETGNITINKSQWEEIQAVLSGKRKSAYSQEFDGYTPKTVIYWN